MSAEPTTRQRRRRLGFAALASTVAAALGLGFFADRLVASPEQVRARNDAPPASILTANVQRGRLTSTVVFRATVTPGQTVTISPAVSGVVTSLPLSRGSAVGAGTLLMTVNDRPVIALPGHVPLYRELRIGDSGRDVERLQTSLLLAGYSSGETGVFGPGTAAALRNLYASVGIAPPTEAGGRKGVERFVTATPDELVFVPDLPGTVGKVQARLGSDDLQEALVLQSTEPDLLGDVNPVDAAQLRVDQRVRIDTPDGAAALSGRIRSIGPPRIDETRGRVAPITIEPQGTIPQDWDGIELRVMASTSAKTAKLYVPTSALETAADGSVYVTVVKNNGTQKVTIDVIGEANGRTSIRPADGQLNKGDKVVVGVR